MIRNIFLDLDETILDFHKAEHIALSKTLQQLKIEPTKEVLARYSVLNEQQWKLLELGKLDRAQVKVRRYALLFEEIGAQAMPQEAARIYEALLAQGHYFIDGAVELLERLHPDYRLYLASNGTASVQEGRLKSANIGRYFEGIFISEEIGHNKPGLDFFQYCFDQIPDFEREESIIVGDSLTSDIKGGINAGIKTVWFQRYGRSEKTDAEKERLNIHPDYEIYALEQLDEILAELNQA